jgi:hypothetical protein
VHACIDHINGLPEAMGRKGPKTNEYCVSLLSFVIVHVKSLNILFCLMCLRHHACNLYIEMLVVLLYF